MISSRGQYIFLLVAILLWCLLLTLPPILANAFGKTDYLTEISYSFFHNICHQYETRTIFLGEHKMGVCARCSGIYFGFFIGVLIIPFIKKTPFKINKLSFFLISVPMIIDVFLNISGIHTSNLFTRLATGLFFGVNAAVLLYPSFQQAYNEF